MTIEGETPPQSLFSQVARAIRARSQGILSQPWITLSVAGLIAFVPIATWMGATLLSDRLRTQMFEIEQRNAAPQDKGGDKGDAAAMIRASVEQPGVGVTLETLARSLPSDAHIASVRRQMDGGIEMELTTPDPDRLRDHLHRNPAFATMREVGQRRIGDGRILVHLRTRQ